MYKDLRDRNTVLSGLIASASAAVGVMWNNHAEAVSAEMVTGNYFEALGVASRVGRCLSPATKQPKAPTPWPSSISIIGSRILQKPRSKAERSSSTARPSPLSASPRRAFAAWSGDGPKVYVPITMEHTVHPDWDFLKDQRLLDQVLGRLRPGVTRTQAEAP